MCHWHGRSCHPSWLLHCCSNQPVQLHPELTPELTLGTLQHLSLETGLRPTCFATPSPSCWARHFQWPITNMGVFSNFSSLLLKDTFLTFKNALFLSPRMIQWLRRGAWRSVKLYVVIISYSTGHIKSRVCLLIPWLSNHFYDSISSTAS